jgi:hypothetical protein
MGKVQKMFLLKIENAKTRRTDEITVVLVSLIYTNAQLFVFCFNLSKTFDTKMKTTS